MSASPTVNPPTLMLLEVTRGMLGAGIGLLPADRFGDKKQRIGRALFAIGVLSTVTLGRHNFAHNPVEEYVDLARFRESCWAD